MLTDDQKSELLNDFFDWSGGEFPASSDEVFGYVTDSRQFVERYTEGEHREAIDYLMSEIIDDSFAF